MANFRVMRRALVNICAILAIMAFCSCEKNQPEEIVENTTTELTISAEVTRTQLAGDESHAEWSNAGEYLRIYRTADGVTESTKSNEGSVVGGMAMFRASFSTTDAAECSYNAIYPESAVTGSGVDLSAITINVASEQHPSATSYDANADIMVALEQVESSDITALSMRFRRIVAIAKMTITGLDADATIKSVSFTANGKKISGECSVNTSEATITATNGGSDSVSAIYDTAVASNTPIYLMLLPTTLNQNDNFSVTVTTGDDKVYTRDITIPNGRELSFSEGNISTFTVNMSGVTPDGDAGTYVGAWQLVEYRASTEFDFDIYLDIDEDGRVYLWQRLGSYDWSYYESSASFAEGVVVGEYSDGIDWSASYYYEVSDERMTWTDTLDSSDISVYERIENIPDWLLETTRAMDIANSRFL